VGIRAFKRWLRRPRQTFPGLWSWKIMPVILFHSNPCHQLRQTCSLQQVTDWGFVEQWSETNWLDGTTIAYSLFDGITRLQTGDVVFSLITSSHSERLRPHNNHSRNDANKLIETPRSRTRRSLRDMGMH
jgi:hypothetical protein